MENENEFSWSDTEAVVIDRVDAIAVYRNPQNLVVRKLRKNRKLWEIRAARLALPEWLPRDLDPA
jgi:hypothetical protein